MDDKKKKEKTIKSDGINKEKAEENKLIEEWKNKYIRVLADYQNLEKRIQINSSRMIDEALARFLRDIIPFLDNLNKAEIFIKDQGLKMVKNQFEQLLQSKGVAEIDLVGKEYDPQTAEAIEVVEGEKDNLVVSVLEKGYRFKDFVLRPAKVKVSKKKLD